MINTNPTFASLKRVAEAIVAMFGRNCEVAIHDLTSPESSLISLTGNVTDRNIGAPATDLLLRALGRDPATITDLHNYKTVARDGRAIKSSTVFLRDDDNRIYGALCINMDTTDFFTAVQVLAPFVQHETDTDPGETFAASPAETIAALFQQGVVEIGKAPAAMNTTEKIELVTLLEKQGVFHMKGAVKQVAGLAGVSKFTIYNYLKKVGGTDPNRQNWRNR